MSSSASLDSYEVQCVKCFSPLKNGERFCAVCGWDQEPWLPEPEKPDPTVAPATSATSEVAIDINLDAPDTQPPAEYEAALKQGAPAPGGSLAVMGAAPLAASGTGPPPFWQQEANDAAGPSRWTRRIPALLVSLAVALGVVAMVLMVDHFYLDRESEYAKLRELKASVNQARAALRRGDLPAAERVLETLDAEHADDVGVQKLREELDQREEAMAAASAMQSSPTPTPTPEPAALAPAPAPAPPPEPARDEKPCNAALAALSLCPSTPP